MDTERARDVLWTLISEVCRLLVEGRGWSVDQWERWLAGALVGPEGTPSGAEAAMSGVKPPQEGTITSN